jgi:hypothetical protein
MTQAIDTGHLQLYMRDEAVATVLDELNWDGRLDPPTQSDYLLALDTNVGYNKVNATVERGLDYQVTLSENGGGQADLTVVYTHTASTADNACLPTQYGDAPTYQQLTDQCLWNYLRIYTLADSQLLSASEHTVPVTARLYNDIDTYSPQTIAEQPGFTTFTNYFLVPLGDGLTSQYQYELPATIGQSEGAEHTYELLVQKQAGARSQPLHITVTLPPNKEFVSATPAPTAVTDTTIAFSLTLDKNTSITVHYRDK